MHGTERSRAVLPRTSGPAGGADVTPLILALRVFPSRRDEHTYPCIAVATHILEPNQNHLTPPDPRRCSVGSSSRCSPPSTIPPSSARSSRTWASPTQGRVPAPPYPSPADRLGGAADAVVPAQGHEALSAV